MAPAMFAAIVPGFAARQPIEMQPGRIDILAVHQVENVEDEIIGPVIAQELCKGAIGVADPAGEIGDHHAHGGRIEQACQSGTGPRQARRSCWGKGLRGRAHPDMITRPGLTTGFAAITFSSCRA